MDAQHPVLYRTGLIVTLLLLGFFRFHNSAVVNGQTQERTLSITITTPRSSSTVTQPDVIVEGRITTRARLRQWQILLNERVIHDKNQFDASDLISSGVYRFRQTVRLTKTQNIIRVIATDTGGYQTSETVLVTFRPGKAPENPVLTNADQQFPPPRKPAQLSATLSFSEPSNNGLLDAEETGILTVALSDSGAGDAYNLQITVTPQTDISGVRMSRVAPIERLPAGGTQKVEIPLSADKSISSKSITLMVEVSESNGFDLDPPATITFGTKAFVPPDLAIADVGINDQSGNGQIESREVVDITARIQNKSQGEAQNVTAVVQIGANVYFFAESATVFTLGNLKAGEYRDIVFSVFTNSKAVDVPIQIVLKEARGLYDKSWPLNLPFNKPQKRANELIVKEKTKVTEIEDVATLSVDVEVNIPKTNMLNSDAVAVVIGISRYQHPDVPVVDYGKRDATFMKKYLVNMLGFDERRIIEVYDQDAGLAAFKRIFEEQLPNWTQAGKSDVFVFYSGHGAPDPETKDAFFVPYDCNPTYARSTGYRVKEFYDRLARLNARSVTVAIDACFSGSSEKGMLLKSMSPIFVKVENPVAALDNGIVFTASTGQQVASWYPEKKHGIFTYYFLKGLRGDADTDGDRQVTIAEMETYLKIHVTDQARYLNNREQTPEVTAQQKSRVLVKF